MIYDYPTEEFIDALVIYLLEEIRRVYWNVHQKEWNEYEELHWEGMEYRPFDWSDPEEYKPNLKFAHSSQEIRWYKYPMRGGTFTIPFSPQEWQDWFEEALETIREVEERKKNI